MNTQKPLQDSQEQKLTTESERLFNVLFVLALICVALLGAFLLRRSTPYGLGLVNDSAAYIGGADNLLAGNGYTRTSGGGELKPITHFPPLFSLVLASFSFTGFELVEIGHILIMIFFTITIFLTGWMVLRITNSKLLALFTAFLLAFSDTTLGVYAILMSEPLFIMLMLAALLSFGLYYSDRRIRWMVLTGILLGLAYLTRFAAISLFVAILAALLLLARPRSLFRSSFWHPAAALLLGALPFLLSWSFYNYWITGEVGNRQLILHPIPAATLFSGLKNLLTWLAPQDLLSLHPLFGWTLSGISLILPIGLLVMIAWLWISTPHNFSPALAVLTALALHVLAYLAFLVISISLFDASTPLDDRILTIVYIPEMILFAGVLSFIIKRIARAGGAVQRYPKHPQHRQKSILQGLVATLCLVLAVLSLRDGLAAVEYLSRDGLGFNHSGWRNSPVIARVRELPPVILYSNRPTAIYLLTGKSAYVIPTPIDAVTTLSRANFNADVEDLRTRVLNGQAALVLFDMKTEPEATSLYILLTDSLPVMMDLGREQIFAISP